jgi:hypothetical protein
MLWLSCYSTAATVALPAIGRTIIVAQATIVSVA